MSPQLGEIYTEDEAPSIPPATLLKGKVLKALYTLRSDDSCASVRAAADRSDVPLVCRSTADQEVFDASVYSKKQARLLKHQVADVFSG